MSLEAITKGRQHLSRLEPVMAWTRIVAMQMERSGFQCLEAEVAGLNQRLLTRAEGGVRMRPGSAGSRISHGMRMLCPLT